MNKEQKRKSSEIDQLIDDYLLHKTALADLIMAEMEQDVEHSLQEIREHESKVEKAFSALVLNKPFTLAGCIRKLEFFADQITTETELSNYHKEALARVADDFRRLGKSTPG